MLHGLGITLSIAAFYLVVTTLYGIRSMKYNKDAHTMMTAKALLGPFIVGIFMMSEFIGIGSTFGTAQVAFSKGMWAVWNTVSLGIAFILYGYLIAPKYHAMGEYTISGIVNLCFGNAARMIASCVMIFALMALNVSMYTGGGAAVAKLLNIPIPAAVLIIAVISVLIVALGGIRGVAFTNLFHASFKYIGMVVVCLVAYGLLKGNPSASLDLLPHSYWTVQGMGISTLVAWTIANIGNIFVSQVVVQSTSSLTSVAQARKASFVACAGTVPIGFLAVYAGLSAKVLFPKIQSINAVPEFLGHMSPVLAGIVMAMVFAATFVTIQGSTLGCTALVMRDIVGRIAVLDEKKRLAASKLAAVVLGLIPVPFALYVPGLLKVVFFGRAMQSILAVVVVFGLYRPRFNSKRGAVCALLVAPLLTIFWFTFVNSGSLGKIVVAGIRLGSIDYIYVAVISALIVMIANGISTRHLCQVSTESLAEVGK